MEAIRLLYVHFKWFWIVGAHVWAGCYGWMLADLLDA